MKRAATSRNHLHRQERSSFPSPKSERGLGGEVFALQFTLMDEHALRVLEFDKVLARLANLTAFSAGRDLALALQPSPSYVDVLERQRTLAEAMRLREMRLALNLNSAVDVRQALEKAALGGALDGQEP